MSTRAFMALIVMAMALAVCGCSVGNIGAMGGALLGDTQWVLLTLNGRPPLVGTTATFSQGRVGGSTGCNSYSGSYEASGSSLVVKDTAATEMYCVEPAGVMDQEQAFLSALGQVRSYRLADGRLEMMDSTANVVLVFAPTP